MKELGSLNIDTMVQAFRSLEREGSLGLRSHSSILSSKVELRAHHSRGPSLTPCNILRCLLHAHLIYSLAFLPSAKYLPALSAKAASHFCFTHLVALPPLKPFG